MKIWQESELTGIRLERSLRIELADGTVLRARAWLPDVAHRVPAVVALQPYQKDGRSRVFLPDAMHRFLAARGMAAILVDIRGTGSSEGTSRGPFGPQEAQDGREVVEWVARQPWCNGNIGMWGVSYPGLTSLATAALAPPSLKAIAPVHACGDPDRDFVRLAGREGGYWFGAEWGPRMAAYNLLPPLLRDDEWERVWRSRMDGFYPWLLSGYGGPDDRGEPPEEIPPFAVADIRCPSMHIVGWRDLFAGATLRDWAACQGPKRLVVGPWKHSFPDTDPWNPAPLADEIASWFHGWLAAPTPTEDPDAPPVAFYIQGHGGKSAIEGWYRSDHLPLATTTVSEWSSRQAATLERGGAPGAAAERPVTVPATNRVGHAAVVWDGWTPSLDTERPWDLSREEADSVVLTSDTLPTDVVLVGTVELALDALAAPDALLCVRLLEVTSDNRSVLITRGWGICGGHVPGPWPVAVSLAPTAYVVPAGSRLRVAISASDAPTLWTTEPGQHETEIDVSSLSLRLPTVDRDQLERHAFGGDLRSADLAIAPGTSASATWKVIEDLTAGTVALRCDSEDSFHLEEGGECRISNRYEARVTEGAGTEPQMHSTTEAVADFGHEVVTVLVEVVTTRTDIAITAKVDRSGTRVMDGAWRKSRLPNPPATGPGGPLGAGVEPHIEASHDRGR